MLMIFIP